MNKDQFEKINNCKAYYFFQLESMFDKTHDKDKQGMRKEWTKSQLISWMKEEGYKAFVVRSFLDATQINQAGDCDLDIQLKIVYAKLDNAICGGLESNHAIKMEKPFNVYKHKDNN